MSIFGIDAATDNEYYFLRKKFDMALLMNFSVFIDIFLKKSKVDKN